MVDLSEEQKKTLRAEESYRREVRRELESNTSPSVLQFFNTPLGIWLLTVVVICLISFGYFVWQSSPQSHNLSSDNTLVFVSKESLDIGSQGNELLQAIEKHSKDIGKTLEPKATNSVLTFFNSPLGIWFLSTVVVGFLSFGYKVWQDSRHLHDLRQEEKSGVIDERNFRIRQLDRTIEVAAKAYKKVENRQNRDGVILGSEFLNFIESAKLITVTIELGGILSVPHGENDNSWIGTSGYGLRHLLYKRSFKKEQYASESLLDLGKRLEGLYKGNKAKFNELEKSFDCLEGIYPFDFKEILEDWHMRHQAQGKYKSIYNEAYKVYETEMSDYGDEIKVIGRWIYSVQACWQTIKSNKLMELMN
ncbi:hypothetical protein QNF02_000908 [Vibrio vulnificus]|nr:hypothetical protein [Vibrio vulnificus]ELC9571029.1 hypothetical protein [Vibrio vulnificus]ELV8585591.1 hypothetical protein [Vibrio vulnificus]ELV8628820.1 hypothetical protein [Vibrio vulnificus]ELV8636942.1 hypothetical protein [Vibrio vulnificus]